MGRSRGPNTTAAEEDPKDPASRPKRRRVTGGSEPWDIFPLGGSDGKRGLYHCNYCQKDISNTVRIKCAKCTDFDLCVECFSVGAEVKPHKANHPYHVMDNLSFPLFDPEWNADEEILLLEGVEMYGLGNWGEVAEHIGTKNRQQCYQHYMTGYMQSPCAPLPDMAHVAGKTKAELIATSKLEPQSRGPTPPREGSVPLVKQEPGTLSSVKQEETKDEEGPGDRPKTPEPSGASGKGVLGGPKLDGEAAAKGGEAGTGAKKSAGAAGGGGGVKEETLGPASSEGEHPQSKRTLGGKMPKPGGTPGEPDKLSVEQTGYNAKRDEFDPEYDNAAEVPLAEMEFKETDNATDRDLKVRMLEIYLSRLDERKRRKEFILERGLLSMRRQQLQDRRRSKEERELFQRGRVFARYQTPEEHEALLSGLNAERKIRQHIEELQEYRAAGCHTLAEGEQYETEKRKREMEQSLRRARESASYSYGKANHRANRYLNRERSEGESGGSPAAGQKARGSLGGGGTPSAGTSLGRFGSKKAAAALELTGHPGAELLSSQERDICSHCRLLPAHYLKMKEALMSHSALRGGVSREDARLLFKVDPGKTDAVYAFLVSKGWVQGEGLIVAGTRRGGRKDSGLATGRLEGSKGGLGLAGEEGRGEEKGQESGTGRGIAAAMEGAVEKHRGGDGGADK